MQEETGREKPIPIISSSLSLRQMSDKTSAVIKPTWPSGLLTLLRLGSTKTLVTLSLLIRRWAQRGNGISFSAELIQWNKAFLFGCLSVSVSVFKAAGRHKDHVGWKTSEPLRCRPAAPDSCPFLKGWRWSSLVEIYSPLSLWLAKKRQTFYFRDAEMVNNKIMYLWKTLCYP